MAKAGEQLVAFCPDEEFLINPSAKSLIAWRPMAVLGNFRKNPA